MRPRRECPTCGKQISAANYARHQRSHENVPPAAEQAPPPSDESLYADAGVSPAGDAAKEGEKKRGWSWRTPRPKSPKAAKPPRKRGSTQWLWDDVWGGLASVAAGTGDLPVARAMILQAPAAGAVIEEATKGTVIDKVVQPIARAESPMMALVGIPLAIGILERNPASQAVLVPAVRRMMRPALMSLVQAAKREKSRQAEYQVAMEELADLLPPELKEYLRGPTAVEDALLAWIFSPPPPEGDNQHGSPPPFREEDIEDATIVA